MKKVLNYIMRGYVLIMLCVFPLFILPQGYNGIDVVKYRFFEYVTCAMIVSALLMVLLMIPGAVKSGELKASSFKPAATDICAAAYLIICVIAYTQSSYRSEALYGFNGWFMGLLSQIMFVLIYFIVSRTTETGKYMYVLPLAAGMIVYGIGIAQRFGYDFGGFYRELTAYQIAEFLSTQGQITWYSSYAMLILPIGMYVYIMSEKTIPRVIGGLYLCLHGMMVCTIYSDSAYIGAGVTFIVYLVYVIRHEEKLSRFMETVMIFAASFCVIGAFKQLLAYRVVHAFYGSEDLSNMVTDLKVAIPVFAVSGIVYMIVRIKPKLIYVCLGVAVAAMIIFACFNGDTLGRWLTFDDSWGSYRGLTWRLALETYGELPVKYKIIGTGPDTFSYIVYGLHADELAHTFGSSVAVNAHNEWINTLINEGILGLIAYAGIFISSFIYGIRSLDKRPEAIICIAAVCAYICHNFFCYQQCVCTPVVFIFMGLCMANICQPENDQ